jgi:hypothetical protein
MADITAADVIDYNTAIKAQALRVGNPIYFDDTYTTITATITDLDRGQVVVQAKDDDKRTHVYYIGLDDLVDVGTVIQYGIDRDDRPHIMPVHTNHGGKALARARSSIAQYGGRLMTRSAVPDTTSLTGGVGVDDWTPVDV